MPGVSDEAAAIRAVAAKPISVSILLSACRAAWAGVCAG